MQCWASVQDLSGRPWTGAGSLRARLVGQASRLNCTAMRYSALIRQLESRFLPGLLQTPEYDATPTWA